MCDLIRGLDRNEFEGFKVVAEEIATCNNFSLAMGFCYEDHPTKIPEVVLQTRISEFFRADILNSGALRSSMVGRTAVFTSKKDALRFRNKIRDDGKYFKHFLIKVKKAVVSNDLMSGVYRSCPVVAGRKIQIFEEVTE